MQNNRLPVKDLGGGFKIIPLLVFMTVFVATASPAIQQDSSLVNISLSTKIDRTETPMNIPVPMTVIMSWEGTPDRFIIGPFESPVLTNLEIVGSQSKSRTELREGKIFTVKEYSYLIQPMELGMGYVESIIIEYNDNMTGVKDRLVTQRMALKGLSPVYEGDNSLLWAGIGILLVTGFFVAMILYVRRRTIVKKLKDIQPVLAEDSVNDKIKSIRMNTKTSFKQKTNDIFKEFRIFLIDRFDVPEDSKSDSQMIQSLIDRGAEDEIASKVRAIFDMGEQIRYSGKEIRDDDFEAIYGAVETCITLCAKTGSENTGN